MIIDYFFYFYSSLESKKIKKDFLKIYAHETISKITKIDQIIINNPKIVILGLGETTEILKYSKEDDFTNGFLSRFATIFANLEKEKQKTWRPNRGFANTKTVKVYWSQIKKFINVNKEFTVNESAQIAFRIVLEQLNHFEDLDAFYINRFYDSILKWSLLHCVLENRKDCQIRAVDIAYGWCVVLYLQKNILEIFDFYSFLPFEKKKHQIKVIIKRLKTQGKKITLKNILSAGSYWFQNVKEVRYVLDQLKTIDKYDVE